MLGQKQDSYRKQTSASLGDSVSTQTHSSATAITMNGAGAGDVVREEWALSEQDGGFGELIDNMKGREPS